jgi:branched-chain amino acid transport system permease protein
MSEATADEADDDGLIGQHDALLVASVIAGLAAFYLVGGALLDFGVRQQVNSVATLLFYVALFAMLGLALNLHWGYTGLFNIGVIGFMAVGIYTTAVLSKSAALGAPPAGSTGGLGLPLWLGAIGGVIAAALFGGLIALPALRLRADYFAIITVGVSEIVRFTVMAAEFQTFQIGPYYTGLGGGSGLLLPFDPVDRLIGFFGLTGAYGNFTEMIGTQLGLGANPKPVIDGLVYVAVLMVFLVMFYALLRRTGNSPFGRVLKAIREDEEATQSLGKNTNRFKIKAFMIGCGLMGLGGILFYGSQGAITPNSFRPRLTFFIWIALIIGGAGSNTGSVLGGAVFAAFLFRGPIFLKNVVQSVIEDSSLVYNAPSDFAEALTLATSGDVLPLFFYVIDNLSQLQLVFMGVVLILLMHNRPEGILGHRKEPASPIQLTRRKQSSAEGAPTPAADGGRPSTEGDADE